MQFICLQHFLRYIKPAPQQLYKKIQQAAPGGEE